MVSVLFHALVRETGNLNETEMKLLNFYSLLSASFA